MNSERYNELCNSLPSTASDSASATVVENPAGSISNSDTSIFGTPKIYTESQYRTLLDRLEDQGRRAQLLSELIRLFASSHDTEQILEKVVAKSTEVLGDSAFILLNTEGELRLEAAFSKDQNRLVRMLMTTLNSRPHAAAAEVLRGVLEDGVPLVIPNLPQATATGTLRPVVEKFGLLSLLAAPIHSKEGILGAFVSASSSPRVLDERDLATASELSNFTAMVMENGRLFAELQRSASTDSLTGVYNTRFFHKILSGEAARAHRYDTPLSLLMIDVDAFKLVNDTFGHLVGDKVLNAVARALGKAVRNTDFISRCGGDEFGVVLPGTTKEGAILVAEKILQKVESSHILQNLGYSGSLTVSIGAAEYQKGTHFETLVADADQALYASKRSSKNCVRAFSTAAAVRKSGSLD